MRTTIPNYKEHLREAIARGASGAQPESHDENDEDINIASIASPEASILSSAHSRSISTTSEVEQESFLSVTPSMLNSSIFEVASSRSSSVNTSRDSNLVCDNNEKNDNSYTAQEESTRGDEELARALQQIENEEEKEDNTIVDNYTNHHSSWHDRSTFESIGSRMYDDNLRVHSGGRQDDSELPSDSLELNKNKETEEESESTGESEKSALNASTAAIKDDSTSKKAGVLSTLLEVGTIAAGIFGIVLILTSKGGNSSSSNEQTTSKHIGSSSKSWSRKCERGSNKNKT